MKYRLQFSCRCGCTRRGGRRLMGDGFESVTEEILILVESHLPQKVPKEHAKIAIAIGWYIGISNSLRAAILLGRSGFGGECSPLLRYAIEHLVAIEWLAIIGDEAFTTLASAHKMWAETLEKAVAKTEGWELLTSELFEEIAAIEVSTAHADAKIKSKFDVAGQFDLYVSYLTETAYSHPTLLTANDYLRDDGHGNYLRLDNAESNALNTFSQRCSAIALFSAKAVASTLDSNDLNTGIHDLEIQLASLLSQTK